MYSGDDLSAKVDKRGDRGDESDDDSCFSHVGNINVHLNANNGNGNKTFFDVDNTYKQPNEGAFRNSLGAEIKAS